MTIAYADLPDIMAARRFSPEHDHPLFWQISTAAARLGVHDKYLLTLLHTHFQFSENEVLVESIDFNKRKSIKRCHDENRVHDVYPISWRLNDDGSTHPLEYTASASYYNCTEIGGTDATFFKKTARILRKHGQINRFGIAIWPAIFNRESEALREITDGTQRILESSVISRTSLDQCPTIETAWFLHSEMYLDATKCRERPTSRCAYDCRTKYLGDYREEHERKHYVSTGREHYDA